MKMTIKQDTVCHPKTNKMAESELDRLDSEANDVAKDKLPKLASTIDLVGPMNDKALKQLRRTMIGGNKELHQCLLLLLR